MAPEQEQSAARRIVRTIRAVAWVFLLVATARCDRSAGPTATGDEAATLRIGVSVGQGTATNPLAGVEQVAQLFSMESLARIAEDGRPQPWLASGWTVSPDQLTVTLRLRPQVTFQDGSPVTAVTVADILKRTLPRTMGPAFEDVRQIDARGDTDIVISLSKPTPFLLEGLEAPIQKPGAPRVGTGPFMRSPNQPTELVASHNYYLGRAGIGRIAISTYPSVRAAWAEMLRDHLDMLWDVGVDALSSFERAKNISVFKYTRHYQYVVIFNTQGSVFQARDVRRALSLAIDRQSLVRDALDENGTPSSGPIWPQHWAFRASLPKLAYEPQRAADMVKAQFHRMRNTGGESAYLHFTCFVPPDYERIALVVKRQLEAIGVEMAIEEASPDRIYQAMGKHQFDAILFDAISAPSLYRPYLWWHSGTTNPAGFSSPIVDAALDRIRHAASDDEYRAGVAAFQQAMMDDPPAIFLAWGQRARAVSNRFQVPAEPGRDVLATLRLWKPQADTHASRN